MKLTRQQARDLLTMIEHSRRDISFREGGSFVDLNNEEEVDHVAVKSVERAIDVIKQLILQP